MTANDGLAFDALPRSAPVLYNLTLAGGLEGLVAHQDAAPKLVSAAHRPNPDPRPRLDSPALKFAMGAVPPSDGLLDTGAQYIGAFGDSNWLEEWTFFGPESDYGFAEEDSAE